MNEDNKILKNLKTGKYIILISNIFAAIIFFFVYLSLKNIIVLFVVLLLIISSFVVYLIFTKFENRFKEFNYQQKDQIE